MPVTARLAFSFVQKRALQRTYSEFRAATRAPLQPTRLAELVASDLRARILHGELHDGELLPTQDELCGLFEVGKVTIREALRILENEGLATIRRGNVGGVIVHSPTPHAASRMLAMVMEGRRVQVSQLAAALQELEPLCATLCATRADRMKTVVPALRALLDESESVLSDSIASMRVSRRFHEAIVNGCGNDALLVTVGALESIWSAVEEGWALRDELPSAHPDLPSRRVALRTHQRITAFIAEGKADGAARLVRGHSTLALRYSIGSYPDRPVTVADFG